MKIFFARHGESQANLLKIISNRDLPHGLTEDGCSQAQRLAQYLLQYSISHIYTSPLLRAVQTSAIIAERLNIEYEQVDGLREYDCGVAEGRSDEAAWQLWQKEYQAWVYTGDYDYHIEGGESFQQVRERFTSFVEGLIGSFSGSSAELLCISHGGLYSVMFPWIMPNVNAALMAEFGFDYISCIVAEYKAGGLVCTEWNGMAV